jgi:hypothetical protein
MKHKLLLRQIKHFTGNPETLPSAEENFTSAVDEAYQQRDNYFYLLEHAIDVSSEEFNEKRTRVEPLSRFSDENPYPVMRTPKEGILYYANSANQKLLKTFGMEVKRRYWIE